MTSPNMSACTVEKTQDIPHATLTVSEVWPQLRAEAEQLAKTEPLLKGLAQAHILDADTLVKGLSLLLADKLGEAALPTAELVPIFNDIYAQNPELADIAARDMLAILHFDPAARDLINPFLFYKGFHALQGWRLASALWRKNRNSLALFLQNRISRIFAVDIHPAAKFGHGVVLDHATGIVIGETAIVGNNVLMLHGVTLGTKDFERGDRHPVIGDNVIIGAGAKILGRTHIGDGAIIAAGSLVVDPVAPGNTVAGVPARVIRTS